MGEQFPGDQNLLQALTEAVNGQSRSILAVMQGMQTEITKVVEKMDKLTDKVDETQSRLVAVEQQRHGKDIADLRGDVKALGDRLTQIETVKSRAEGVALAAGMLKSWAPVVVAMFFFLAVYFGLKPNPLNGAP